MLRPALAALMMSALFSVPVIASAQDAAVKPDMSCKTGPVTHEYGGTSWLVYSCSDGQSLVFITAPGNPAMPFYFVSYPKDGQFQLSGEGTGSKTVTDAAYAQLSQMTSAERESILAETKAVPAAPPSN